MSQYYLQQLINGLMLGSLYALVAIGFSMIYGIVRLINFAHGDVLMIGAFATLALVASGTPWLLVAPVVLLTGVLAGITIERAVFRPIRGAPQVTGFIATLALSVMIENGGVMLLSPQPRNFLFPDVMRMRVPIGPATVSLTDLVIIATTLILAGVLVLIVRRTRLGMAMRATAENLPVARLMGINDKLEARRVALWTDNSMDFTKALSAFFKERFTERGGEIVGEDQFMMGDTDFSAQIARLQSIEPAPDAVFISAIPNEAGITVKQIRETGLELPIVSGDGFDTELVVETPGPELADEVYFSTHTYRADDRPEVTAFVEAYTKEYGHAPENAFAPLGYDAMRLVADAIGRAGSTEPDAIRQALAETKGFPAVTGEISYTRESMVPPKPVSIISVKDGAYVVEEIWKP